MYGLGYSKQLRVCVELGRDVSEIVVKYLKQLRFMYPAIYPRILYSNLTTFGILGVGLVSQDNYGGSLPHNTIRKPLLVACVNFFL